MGGFQPNFHPFKKLHRHRPQIAFPKKQSAFSEHSESNSFYCEFASVHLPLVPEEMKSLREKTGRKGGGGSQEQLRMEIMKGDKLRRQDGSGRHGDDEGKHMKGDKAAGTAKSSTEWGDRPFLAWRVDR